MRAAADHISIHALRVEGDGCMRFKDLQAKISIHALRVEGDQAFPPNWFTPSGISIHALRVEGDNSSLNKTTTVTRFLSTPSGWRATAKTDKVFICFCAKGRRICLFKTRKEKNLPMAF